MKYVVLIYSNPASWTHPMFLHQRESLSQEEQDTRMNEFAALLDEIGRSGELVGHAALADPINTKTVRMREGSLAVTDGPFLEAKEHLAGYFVVDCDSVERATEIAARFPDAHDAAVEVRPIMDLSGLEM